MDLPLTVVALLAGAGLAVWWGLRLRHDLRRRDGRAVEWQGLEGPPQLWTSAARCPRCTAGGALLQREGDRLWHTCLACGHRHARDHPA